MDIGALRVVLSMATADFTGPAREAGETVKSSGGLMQAAATQIKGAMGEAFSGTPLSEFATMWQEVAEKVQSAAGEVEGAVGHVEASLGSLDGAMTDTGADAATAAGQVSAAMDTIEGSVAAAATEGTAGLATLNEGLATTGTASEGAGTSAAAGGAAMGGAFALAPQIALITGLTMALSKVPEAMDAIKDSAKDYDESIQTIQQLTGATVQDSSLLVDVFQRYGISAQQSSKDIDQLSRSGEAAIRSATGPQADAYKELGVSLTNYDGTLKSSTDLFYQVGAALAAMPDGIAKTNDEMQIFGRSGTDLNEMFHATTEGGEDWIHTVAGIEQQAQSTGQVLTTSGMASFEKYQQATRDSSAASAALKEQLGNAFLPVMTDVDNGLASLASGFDTKVLPALGHADDEFKQVWSELAPLRDGLGQLMDIADGGVADAFRGLGDLLGGPFGGVLKVLAGATIISLIAVFVALVAPIIAVGLAVKGTEAILDDFGEAAYKSVQWGESVYHSMVQAGTDLVQGLIDGIKGKVDDLMSMVASIPKNIVTTLETGLGISSPSTEGIRIGGFFSQGVALGITQNRSSVTSAVASLGQSMGITGHSAAVGAASQMVSPISASGNQQAAQPVVIHNYMGNKPIETVVGTAVNGVFRQQSRRQN